MDQTEVGRIFSCLALVSALVQFVSGPMYAVIYNQTLDTFPGTFMLTTSLIIFVAMVITVLVKRLMSKGQLNIASPLKNIIIYFCISRTRGEKMSK